MSTLQWAWGLGLVVGLAFLASDARGQEGEAKAKPDAETPKKPKLAQATFGGGCFWCTEAFFEYIPGVKSVVSGYSGGNVPNPTYEMICTGLTGHAEVIQITYDPDAVSFETLLDFFWAAHDPTTVDAQGPDHGPQYRSIILYHDAEQKKLAEQSKKDQNALRAGKSPVVTQIVPFETFYPAEDYHQDFARNNPSHGYVQNFFVPKIPKLKAKLKALEDEKTRTKDEPKAE